MEREQLRALTGARFFAALIVVLYHSEFSFFFLPALPAAGMTVLFRGYLSVTFFFLLSGFVLSYGYHTEYGRLRVSRGDFWIARLARIYPVYLLGLLLDLIPFIARQHDNIHTLALMGVASPVLMQAWIPLSRIETSFWNPPGWSLSNEAYFYLLFPFLLLFLGKLKRPPLYLVTCLLWLLLWLIPYAIILIGTEGARQRLPGEWVTLYVANPLRHVPEFFLGMIVGMRFTPAQPHNKSRTLSLHDPLLILLAVTVVYVLLRQNGVAVVEPYVVPLFLISIYLLGHSRGLIASTLGSKPLVLLGEMSYSVYILHWPIWSILDLLGVTKLVSGWLFLALYLSLILTLSAFSYFYVERPARRWIRLVWSRRQQRAQNLKILAPTPVSGRAVAPSEASQRS